MVPDCLTDTVFVSDLLRTTQPEIEHQLRVAFGSRLRSIAGTRDIWCRDYMPVQLDRNRFVQFRYDPDYLKRSPGIRTRDGAGLLDLPNCRRSSLVMDGGNVVRWLDAAVVTDKIYQENRGMERRRLRDRLRTLLELDRLVVIPKEPGDLLGHADGMVRFVDDQTVLVNDYTTIDPTFEERLRRSLSGFTLVSFPYCPTGEVINGMESAEGVYINFLQINDVILLPAFGLRTDGKALSIVKQLFPGVRVLTVRSNDLAREGGLLNCVTWNIKLGT